MKTRTSNSIKNSSAAFIGQIIVLLLQFTTQTVFVRVLGANYVGANGLFSNLLTLLSFADLGIGGAITYALFEPLAKNDEGTISAIMRLFRNAYHTIGTTIFVFGFLFSFFIDNFVNKSSTIPNVQLMFILFVSNSAASYFFAYLRSLLVADQQGYIDTFNRVFFVAGQTIFQVIFLIIEKKYIIFLIIQLVFTVAANVSLQRRTIKRFPYLKKEKKKKVPVAIVQNIKKNILGAVASRFGIIITNGTDNLILSSFLGLSIVGKYTSYLLILNSVQNILTQAFNAVISSVANYSVEKKGKDEATIFFRYQYLVFGIAYVTALSIFFILQKFITVWIGSSYHLLDFTVMLLITVWYFNVNRLSIQAFITAHGLYWETKWKSIAEALVNLVVSIFLISKTNLGVNSVILGTLAAHLLVNVWWEPLVLFHFGLKMKVKKYVYRYVKNIVLYVVTLFLIRRLSIITNLVHADLLNIVFWGILSFIFLSLVYLLTNLFSKEQMYFIRLIMKRIIKCL